MVKESRPSLSEGIRIEARKLALQVSRNIRNGNRSDARKLLREADKDIALIAVASVIFIDGPDGAREIAAFLDSLADF